MGACQCQTSVDILTSNRDDPQYVNKALTKHFTMKISEVITDRNRITDNSMLSFEPRIIFHFDEKLLVKSYKILLMAGRPLLLKFI